MARNILITRRDWLQDPAASLAGGVWSLPLANILDPRPQIVAEAADNRDWAATQFTADLGHQCKVGVFFFANLRATSLGLMRLRAGMDPTFATNAYDSGVVTTWPQDSVAGDYDAWGEWTLNGVYRGDEYARLGLPRLFIPPAIIDCRYIKVEIRDATAALPLQIGCFGACEAWEPPLNFAYGWSVTPQDESDVQRLPFGSTEVTVRGMRRRLNLGFQAMPESELWARSFGLALVKGKSQPLVVVPFSDPSEEDHLEKAAVYGLVVQDGQISNPYFARYAQPFQVDQLL